MMNIELIAIGNEILSGATTNTNASFLGQQLLQAGFRVTHQTVLPDDREQLHKGLEEALNRNQLVITTGGLGPTCDDITREIAAELFHSAMGYRQDLANSLRKRYGECFSTIDNQATVPEKAKLLNNNVGTASGLVFQEDGRMLIMLPGVPSEMRDMWQEALPYIEKFFKDAPRAYTESIYFFNLPESTVDPSLRELKAKNSNVDYGIYPGQGTLSVSATIVSSDKQNAKAILRESLNKLKARFSSHFYEAPSGKLEYAVHNRFIKEQLTLSAAESCTGGSFSSRLISIPGASHYFLGSMIAYTNELKVKVLGVPEELIFEKGAVSSEVVRAMCKGILALTDSDYGVAVSGVAGPTGGSEEKPVGTVWLAIGKRGEEPKTWKIHAYGNREMVIERSVNALLASLV